MAITNTSNAFSVRATMVDTDPVTIFTQAQAANGLIIREVKLVGESGFVVNLNLGGSVSLRTSPVTHELRATDILVTNEACTVSCSGTPGTGYATVTYEYI